MLLRRHQLQQFAICCCYGGNNWSSGLTCLDFWVAAKCIHGSCPAADGNAQLGRGECSYRCHWNFGRAGKRACQPGSPGWQGDNVLAMDWPFRLGIGRIRFVRPCNALREFQRSLGLKVAIAVFPWLWKIQLKSRQGVLLFFSDPGSENRFWWRNFESLLFFQQIFSQFYETRESRRPDLQCSVHTGEVLAGNIGSPTRMKPGSREWNGGVQRWIKGCQIVNCKPIQVEPWLT